MQRQKQVFDEIKIVNVVSTADLKQSIDIASFNKYKHLTCNLDLYRCGYIKDDIMVGRVSVFANGKLISAGAKSIEQSYFELKKACKILKDYHLTNSYKIQPKIQNIVANVDFECKLDIEKLIGVLPRSIYEPEQFPGLIYRSEKNIVALIFSTGKIVLVGSKSYTDLNSAFFELKQRLKSKSSN